MNLNDEVSKFLSELNFPLDKEIQYLRTIILSCEENLVENIKWNGPNYSLNGEDRITMRVQSPKIVQLIFHRGAKVKEQPANKLLSNDFGLLDWKANDRAIISFKSLESILLVESKMQIIIKDWIELAK